MIEKERILVHACCASCACYVLPHLGARFAVAAFFYNPNVEPEDEHRLRLEETRGVCEHFHMPFEAGPYENAAWRAAVEAYGDLPEGSERCVACYRLRLEKTARRAASLGIPIFTTTLSVSPHKVYARIVAEGNRAAERHGVRFLAEDFKKKDGFKRSVELSRELGLTRQDYCGCLMSLEQSRRRRSGAPG